MALENSLLIIPSKRESILNPLLRLVMAPSQLLLLSLSLGFSINISSQCLLFIGYLFIGDQYFLFQDQP